MEELEWGPTGVVPYVEYHLSRDHRERIARVLCVHDVQAVPEAFWIDIEKAIRRFKGYAELHAKSTPARVRENLSAALDTAILFRRMLGELDGNSIQLINRRRRYAIRANRVAMRCFEREVRNAIKLAEAYPKRGRLPEYHRQFLAADVEHIMRSHLKIEPSGTKERGSKSSLYSALLAEILSIATNREVSSVHGLVSKTLRKEVRVVDEQGVIFYKPADRAE